MSWVCKDCGTNNDDALTECMVCGCTEKYVEPVEEPTPAPSTPTSPSRSSVHDSRGGESSVLMPSSPSEVATSPASAAATHTPARHRYTPVLEGWQIALIVIGCAVLVAGVTLLGVFGSQIVWWEWQHIIGSIVGALLVVGVLVVSFCVDSSEAYKGGIIGAVVVAVLNVILGFALKNDYNIIFYWIGAYTLIGLVVATICSAADYEDGWAFFGFIAIVVNAVFFIIITILSVTLNIGFAAPLDPDASRAGQWAAGVLLSIAFSVGMFFFVLYISDEHDVGGILTSILTAVLTIINIALGVALGNRYQVVFGWFSASHIVVAGIGVFWALMNDEDEYAYPGNIGVICLNIAMLVIINMYDG